jgi:protein-disulfide isomerase
MVAPSPVSRLPHVVARTKRNASLRKKVLAPPAWIGVAVALLYAGPVLTSGTGVKAIGSAQAPVVIEIFTDFQCPACRAFYFETLPRLKSEYIDTGKVYLVQRDFPLLRHNSSRLAARYANAAGEVGLYGPAVKQLFESQLEWSLTGDVDSALSAALQASDMAKIRELVRGDARLDELIEIDIAAAQKDGIAGTPSIEFVAGAYRQHIPGTVPYKVLKGYLDQLLSSITTLPEVRRK